MEQKKKKRPVLHAILVTAGILLLVLIFALIGVVTLLLIKFNQTAHEYQPPVERTDTYVLPDPPEVVTNLEIPWEPDDNFVIPETESDITDTEQFTEFTETESETEADISVIEPELETEAKEKIEPKPKSDSKPATVTQPPKKETSPVETLPSTVNTPIKLPQEIKYNTAASFGNTANTVSVYGATPIYSVKQKNSDIVNILVMGTDSRDVTINRGLSDTMIVVSYNSKTGEIKMTSLLRDCLVPIEGHDYNRLNTAYIFGGVGLSINTINQLFDLDIQQFIVIDFNGVKDFIDYIGGVELTFTQEEIDLYNQYWGTKLEAGTHQCNSNMAMSHMRNRTLGSDFARTRRQRETITAVINKILKEKSLTELYDIVDYSFGLIKTNISAIQFVSYATSILGNASKLSITTQNVPFTDAYSFAWYKQMAILSFDIPSTAKRLNEFIYN